MAFFPRTALGRALFFPIAGAVLYIAFILGLTSPAFQAHNLYLHKVQFPINAKFNEPERYGLAPHKARNLRFNTSDGLQIGAWHILPEPYHRAKVPAFDAPALDSASFDEAFRNYPTILYFHGNAANRAAPFRIAAYNQFSSRLSASVVAIDYRGFGDSEGTPSEAGLIRDAKAAWDWLMESKRALGIPEDEARQNVMVAGQSLGTGVAVGLTKLLVEAGTPPKALYLMAPYMSIIRLLTSYAIGGAIPIFAPLRLVPHHLAFFQRFLYTRFENNEILPAMVRGKSAAAQGSADEAAAVLRELPHIIISHADDDNVIPCAHGESLFDGLVKANLGIDASAGALDAAGEAAFQQAKSKHITTRVGTTQSNATPWVRVHTFSSGSGGSVSLIRAIHGGHNTVNDGVISVVGELAGINGPICP